MLRVTTGNNHARLDINNRAIFRKSDLFDKVREGEVFDVIVSNPPYIPYGVNLSEEVMHEPKLALFAKENGLYFYKKIIEEAPKYLVEDGYLMFELGIDEASAVKSMMEKNFTEITIENFVDLIDDLSWEEFMPEGVDKQLFKKFIRYYS